MHDRVRREIREVGHGHAVRLREHMLRMVRGNSILSDLRNTLDVLVDD